MAEYEAECEEWMLEKAAFLPRALVARLLKTADRHTDDNPLYVRYRAGHEAALRSELVDLGYMMNPHLELSAYNKNSVAQKGGHVRLYDVFYVAWIVDGKDNDSKAMYVQDNTRKRVIDKMEKRRFVTQAVGEFPNQWIPIHLVSPKMVANLVDLSGEATETESHSGHPCDVDGEVSSTNAAETSMMETVSGLMVAPKTTTESEKATATDTLKSTEAATAMAAAAAATTMTVTDATAAKEVAAAVVAAAEAAATEASPCHEFSLATQTEVCPVHMNSAVSSSPHAHTNASWQPLTCISCQRQGEPSSATVTLVSGHTPTTPEMVANMGDKEVRASIAMVSLSAKRRRLIFIDGLPDSHLWTAVSSARQESVVASESAIQTSLALLDEFSCDMLDHDPALVEDRAVYKAGLGLKLGKINDLKCQLAKEVQMERTDLRQHLQSVGDIVPASDSQ